MRIPARRIRESITIRTYDELQSYVKAFAAGHLNLLIIVGAGGTGKSRAVRDALGGSKVCWFEGNASPLGMYMQIYRQRDNVVVIDDVDSLYSERNGVRLLKCLCQTEAEKSVSWHTSAAALQTHNIPQEFRTTSRVIIISNDWRTLNRNVEAVQDRGHVIVFDPKPEEVHRHVQGWFRDQEILQWMERGLATIGRPSIRHYLRAAELKRAGLDWSVAVVHDDTTHPRARLVRALAMDDQYASEHERVDEFKRQGAGCRATYFNWKKRLGLGRW